MLLTHVAARLFNKPLLVLPEYAQVMTTGLCERLGVEPMLGQDVVDRYKRPNDRMQIDKRFGIAVLPVVGGMVHRGDGPEAESGVQSYTSLQNHITELLDDRSIRGILLDIDSGGGEAAGIQELAAFVAKASAEKPVWAIANTLAASAAYWLAASADRLYAAPGASVGSIGVYVQHVDVSKMLEKRGIVTTFIFAGEHKVDGNMFESLPENVRSDIQAGVDGLWGEFAGYVAERRDLTTDQVKDFQARVFRAEQAKEAGLVDGVGTLGEVLSAFANYLNGASSIGGQINGANMAIKENALYTESDMAAARAEAHAEGVKAGVAKASSEATAAANVALAEAVTNLFPGSARAEAFVDLLKDGASIAMASKHAAKFEEPKPAAAAPAEPGNAHQNRVDQFMQHHTPNVRSGDDQQRMTDREKRMAEITGSSKAYSRARGYTA